MKDYFRIYNGFDKRSFIRKYDIKNNTIIVYYGNNKKEEIPYSIENEKELLRKMKEQVRRFAEYKEKDILRSNSVTTIYKQPGITKAGLSTIGGILVYMYNLANDFHLPFALLVSTILTAHYIYENKCEEDLELNKRFLNNEDDLKDYFNKNYKKVINQLSIKGKEYFEEKVNSQPVSSDNLLTINDLASLSEEDIKTLLKNVREIDYDNFDYNSFFRGYSPFR